MKKEDPIIRMLMKSDQQYADYLQLVGLVSTTFAQLERELLFVISVIINRVSPEVGEVVVDAMSFRQTRELFDRLKHRIPAAVLPSADARALVSDLKKSEDDRNHVTHGCATLILGDEGKFLIEKVRHRHSRANAPQSRNITLKGMRTIHASITA